MTEEENVRRRELVQGEEELVAGLKERRRWQVTGKDEEGVEGEEKAQVEGEDEVISRKRGEGSL